MIYLLLAFLTTASLFTINSSAQAPNTWTQKAYFGGTARYAAASFSIGAKGYIGTGSTSTNTYSNDFWEYDNVTNTWTQKANVGGTPRMSAVGFSIGNKGYIGTGENPIYLANEFWEYDPSSNSWTQKANFGGSPRIFAVGFSIGNHGYIGTGEYGYNSHYNDFWEYDPSSNTWTQKANFGGLGRYAAVGFSIGAKGYIGTGLTVFGSSSDFWEYDPTTNTWTQKADFGGGVRSDPVGFSIGNKGYVGTGWNWGGFSYNIYNDFWEYDPSVDTWTQKTNFGGGIRYNAVGLNISTKGYIGTGTTSSINYNDFWEYTPSCILPTPPTNTTPPANQNICSGNSTTLSASGIGILGWYNAAIGGTWLGGGTNYTTPILTTNTTYYVQDSTCAASTTRTAIPVTVNTPPVPTITGQTSMCVNSGYYNYITESGMINYLWSVSSGGVINYGSGTNQIQVSWICSGPQTVSVTYANGTGCNAITPTVLNISVNPLPGQAGTITGVSTVCAGDNDVLYSVAPIPNAMSYVWVLPPYATISSGAGTNSITVNYDTNAVSGNVTVYGNNLCGNGTISPDFPVTVHSIPPTPVITNTGDTLYSNASKGNQWYYEGILLAGDTSQTYVANYNGYYWDLVTVNGCSSDTSNHILILLTDVDSHSPASINVYPVPNDGLFNVSITTTLKETFSISIYNTLGIKIYEETEVDVDVSLQKTIDLRPLPGGVYTIIFENSQHQEIKKIIVNK